MALPGWSSPSSVTQIHAALEATALMFFAALVVFDVLAHFSKRHAILLERIGLVCFGIAVLTEICAYPYSRRNDELSAEASTRSGREIARLNEAAKREELESQKLRQENLALQDEVLKLRERMAERHFSAAQRARVAASLLPFAGESASFLPRYDKPEAMGFSRELFDLLSKDAHWDIKETGGLMGRENPEERGVEVDVSSRGTPVRAQKLVDALIRVGIGAHLKKRKDAFPVDEVLIIVNSKPP
jgi:hypothetical protein